MAAIDVVRLTPAEFHPDRIPGPGDRAVLVVGIEGEEGLEAIDEKLAYRLAEDASGEMPTAGSYEKPLLGIGLAMRGYRISLDEYDMPRLQLRRAAYKPFSGAKIGEGEVLVTRSGENRRKLEADWEVDLCYNGVGVVAKARAKTKYLVSRPHGRPWVVTRSLSNENFSIEPNETYKGWTGRNSINPRSPDN